MQSFGRISADQRPPTCRVFGNQPQSIELQKHLRNVRIIGMNSNIRT
jgi:hypothetical protein